MTIREDLNKYKEVFLRAWSGISFNPERRGLRALEDYSNELTQDLKDLGENTGAYAEKYISKLLTCLNSESNCISSMITGPANFPVNSQRKKRGYAESNWNKFWNWRNKYFKSVNRVKVLSPEADLEKAIKDLDSTIIFQENAKSCNKIIKSKKLSKSEKIEELKEYGYDEITSEKLFIPDYGGRIGFASYVLTNNNAKIKRLKGKINAMKSRIETKKDFEPIIFDGGSITIEADRVIINHDSKPDKEVINKIKSYGFRWSRQFGSWSRKHTMQALRDAKTIIGIKKDKSEIVKPKKGKLDDFKYIFFAFSNEQFEKGMSKFNLAKDDYKKIVSIGAGGYVLKDKVDEFRAIIK